MPRRETRLIAAALTPRHVFAPIGSRVRALGEPKCQFPPVSSSTRTVRAPGEALSHAAQRCGGLIVGRLESQWSVEGSKGCRRCGDTRFVS